MAGDTKVTRIKAKDAPKGAASKRKQSTQSTQRTAEKPRRSNKGNPFAKMLRGIGGYFKGAWQELKQVRWPTRQSNMGADARRPTVYCFLYRYHCLARPALRIPI